MKRKSLSIGTKLFACFGAAFSVSLIIGVVILVCSSELDKSLDLIAKSGARKQDLATKLDTNVIETVSLIRGMQLHAFMKDGHVDDYVLEARAQLDNANENLAALTGLVKRQDARLLTSELSDGKARMAKLINEMQSKASSGDLEAMSDINKTAFLPLSKDLREKAAKLKEIQSSVNSEQLISAKALETKVTWAIVFMLLIAVAVGLVVIWIVRKINRDLASTAASLNDGAQQITSAASHVSALSHTLAQGASEQAASLEETSAASNEINSMAARNTENAGSTATLVDDFQRRFVETNKCLDELVVAMESIDQSSNQISRIIKVIDSIAFQTNILALNAAVEAARAGESGVGFAVVADEVRSLAQRSAQAAKDTATLIEDSISRSTIGKQKVDQVALSIRTISSDSVKMKGLVDEINIGGEEQSRGLEQVNRAILQIEQVTQSTAATAEESAAASEELNAQAESVKDVVMSLYEMVGGIDRKGNSLPGHSKMQRLLASRSLPKGVGTSIKNRVPSVSESSFVSF